MTVNDFERELWREWVREFAWEVGPPRVEGCGVVETDRVSQPYCDVRFEPETNINEPIRRRIKQLLPLCPKHRDSLR